MPTLFKAGIDILIFLLPFSGFQSIIGGFGQVGGGVSIYDTHVMNTVCPLCPEVSDK